MKNFLEVSNSIIFKKKIFILEEEKENEENNISEKEISEFIDKLNKFDAISEHIKDFLNYFSNYLTNDSINKQKNLKNLLENLLTKDFKRIPLINKLMISLLGKKIYLKSRNFFQFINEVKKKMNILLILFKKKNK